MSTVRPVLFNLSQHHPAHRWLGDPVEAFQIAANVVVDTAAKTIGTVYFFNGASTLLPPGQTNALVAQLARSGYRVVAPGWQLLPYDPYKYGYGSSSEPQHLHRWIKAAWLAQSVIEQDQGYSGLQRLDRASYVVVSRSLGATAVLALGADYIAPTEAAIKEPGCKGVIADGATLGGLGGNRWNDMNRTLGELSQMIALNTIPEKTVLSYGGLDDYFPEAYQDCLRAVVPAGMRMIRRIGGNHSWFTREKNPGLVERWIGQLMANDELALGNVAVSLVNAGSSR